MRYLRVKNWSEFQHYKDRNPPWIKLHVALLDDYEFCQLEDAAKGQLLLLWLFASKTDGRVPDDPAFLTSKLGLETEPDLDFLVASGWLLPDEGEAADRPKWASRYISDEVRQRVFARDMNRCKACKAKFNLEIDHVTPISHGGTGEESNLQVLCRPCNRRKRTKVNGAAEQVATQTKRPVAQVATQASASSVALARSRETEAEAETEAKKNTVGQKPDVIAVLEFLNEKTGRDYRPGPANTDLIAARLKEGATVDDCRAVVAKKCREWLGDEKMAQYLRPATLFNRTKFAQYVGEVGAIVNPEVSS